MKGCQENTDFSAFMLSYFLIWKKYREQYLGEKNSKKQKQKTEKQAKKITSNLTGHR